MPGTVQCVVVHGGDYFLVKDR